MISIDERLARTKEKLQLLENQKRAQVKREREAKWRADSRRNKTVGELFSKHFPDVMTLTPRRIAAEHSAEFAPIDGFFSALAADEEWASLLKTELSRKMASDSKKADSSFSD